MKIKVRNFVFETNSSSMHSICILKNPGILDYNENIELDFYNGTIHWFSYEYFYFGRHPFELLITPKDKIRYLFANMCPGYHKKEDPKFTEVYNEILEAVKTKYPECNCISLPTNYNENEEEIVYCGEDEDSEPFVELIKKRKIPLEDFIFNPKYFVVIDGDEYCVFDNLIQIGAINMDNIEEIVS